MERKPACAHRRHSQLHSRLRVPQLGHFQSSVAQLFLQPVSIHMEGCRNYYHVIKKPMDLTTMAAKNARNEYKSLDSFSRDFHTMIRNCYRFNVNTRDNCHSRKTRSFDTTREMCVDYSAVALSNFPATWRNRKNDTTKPRETAFAPFVIWGIAPIRTPWWFVRVLVDGY